MQSCSQFSALAEDCWPEAGHLSVVHSAKVREVNITGMSDSQESHLVLNKSGV